MRRVDATKSDVTFSPFIEKTDGNLYNAALHSLWDIYREAARTFPATGCTDARGCITGRECNLLADWNPEAEYCVFPTKDLESGRIGVLTVWVQ